MKYIGKMPNGYAIVFEDEAYANQETNGEYFALEYIPEGSGVLKTDLVSVWWEPVQEPIPEPVPEPEPPTETDDLASLLIDHEYRLTLLELGIEGG